MQAIAVNSVVWGCLERFQLFAYSIPGIDFLLDSPSVHYGLSCTYSKMPRYSVFLFPDYSTDFPSVQIRSLYPIFCDSRRPKSTNLIPAHRLSFSSLDLEKWDQLPSNCTSRCTVHSPRCLVLSTFASGTLFAKTPSEFVPDTNQGMTPLCCFCHRNDRAMTSRHYMKCTISVHLPSKPLPEQGVHVVRGSGFGTTLNALLRQRTETPRARTRTSRSHPPSPTWRLPSPQPRFVRVFRIRSSRGRSAPLL